MHAQGLEASIAAKYDTKNLGSEFEEASHAACMPAAF